MRRCGCASWPQKCWRNTRLCTKRYSRRWGHIHRAIVAPAITAIGLYAAACLQRYLILEYAERLGIQPGGVADRRVEAAARYAVAQGDVAAAVHGGTAHPAIVIVG